MFEETLARHPKTQERLKKDFFISDTERDCRGIIVTMRKSHEARNDEVDIVACCLVLDLPFFETVEQLELLMLALQ